MQRRKRILIKQGLFMALTSLLAATAVSAQNRVAVPAGSVILVRTNEALQSNTAQAGQTFETTVVNLLSVNGYTVIPNGSRVRGVVSYVQPATRSRSGVMHVTFDRLVLPNGTSIPISARLTSTDSVERRQIDARSDPRVVFVGERGGIGAMIAGAGSSSGSSNNILSALGNMLSEGTNVNVPANTELAVQFERGITLSGRRSADLSDPSTIYTEAERIRAAQQQLARRSYYRGTASGVLDNTTRRAIFEFQIDNNITPTGNLDGRTAAALGITGGGTTGADGSVMSARDANLVRRAAQAITSRQRQMLGISTEGVFTSNRSYTVADVELYYAFSAFADNASLYEQAVSSASAGEGAVSAGRALVNAGRRVDAAIQQARTTGQIQNNWQAIRQQLVRLDAGYR
jgi:peptidoglycan hydrolase-like protein with peptidoglycan-binding domain